MTDRPGPLDTEGIIIEKQRDGYIVQTPEGALKCVAKGRIWKHLIGPGGEEIIEEDSEIARTDPVVLGDRVGIQRAVGQEIGIIIEVAARRTKLSRAAAGGGHSEQVIMANADQLVAVFAVRRPRPNWRMLDRFLVAAEMGHLQASICVNKVDLVAKSPFKNRFKVPENTESDRGFQSDFPVEAWSAVRERYHGHWDIYEQIGYPVVYTSALTNEGIEALKALLRNKVSVLVGPSGTGKSSLLNAIQPGLGLRVREISKATGKGRHATSHLQLYPLDLGGMVADTPGLRELGLWQIDDRTLATYFPDIATHLGECHFTDCIHHHEPDCAIKEAVAQGRIHPQRYTSYLSMLESN